MNIEEFVGESLRQIVRGIQEVQKEFPYNYTTSVEIGNLEGVMSHRRRAGGISFDLAVTTSSTGKASAGGSVSADLSIAGLDLLKGGAEGRVEGEMSRSVVSRVAFEVPIVWPGQPEYGRSAGKDPQSPR